jgi:hypothetical protein
MMAVSGPGFMRLQTVLYVRFRRNCSASAARLDVNESERDQFRAPINDTDRQV